MGCDLRRRVCRFKSDGPIVPCDVRPPLPVPRSTLPTDLRLHAGAHIVVADRSLKLLEFMVNTLRAADHCVFQASDGLSALELALSLRNIDLLVSNTYMKGLNGPQLIRQTRQKLPHLPILYIKNHDVEHEGVPEGLPPNVPTLAEPFTAEQLLAAVQPLLGRRAGRGNAEGASSPGD